MTLYYISTGGYDDYSNCLPGTEKKIRMQISCLNKIGLFVKHIHPYPSKIENRFLAYIPQQLSRIPSYIKLRRKLLMGDIVYIRREYHHISYLPLLIWKKNYKVVIETQCIEPAEYQPKMRGGIISFILSYHNYLSMLLFERYIKNKADGIVSVTNEINEYNSNLTGHRLHYLTLGNGIDLSSIPLRSFPSIPGIYHVLMVAGVSAWHGLDRFILGLASYSGSRDICLHIVGNGPEIPHLKELTEKYNLTSKVVFHGFKSGAELDAMFDMCQIALAGLAGHRKNLSEASPLKSREYCARGIPFIKANKDADFPENWPYIESVPADESPIDMNTVISFAERVMADNNHVQTMRKYAEEHLGWDAKMKTLKEFLESL